MWHVSLPLGSTKGRAKEQMILLSQTVLIGSPVLSRIADLNLLFPEGSTGQRLHLYVLLQWFEFHYLLHSGTLYNLTVEVYG